MNSSKFLGAVWNTYRQVFEHVEVIAATQLRAERTTFVLVCSKRPLDLDGLPEAIRRHDESG